MNAQKNEWSDIYCAYQVARLGTLSAAANELGVHHSTILRRIDALEKQLNTRLFHRHARGYTPTEAGKLLYQSADETQENFNKLMGKLAGVDEQLTGTLVITTVNSFVPVLTPLMAEFQQTHPKLRIDLVDDSRIFKLEYGEAHVSIRPGGKPNDPDYIVQHLSELPTTLYASANYLKQYGVMRDRDDLSGHRFVTTIEPLSNIRSMRWLGDSVPTEQVNYRVSDFVSMQQAIRAGIGIGPLICRLADDDAQLQRLFSPPDDWTSDLWLVTHRDIHRSAKVQSFTKFLKTYKDGLAAR